MNLKELLEKKKHLRAKLQGTGLTAEKLDECELELRTLNMQIQLAEEEAERTLREEDIAAGREPANVVAESNETVVRNMVFGTGTQTLTSRRVDPTDTQEYRAAFMEMVQRGTRIPEKIQIRADQSIVGSDVAVMVPQTLIMEIQRKAESYGEIYQKVRKINVRGGVKFPVLSLTPEASWWEGDDTSTESKKTKATDISFTYFGVECKIARNLLVEYTTYESFAKVYVELTVSAIIKAVEKAIISGSGTNQPKGILLYKNSENTVSMTETEMESYKSWKKKVFGKMEKETAGGDFIFAEQTRNAYIDCVTDPSGHLISNRITGIDGKTVRRFDGYDMNTVGTSILKSYQNASDGDVIGIFVDLENYCLNTNSNMYTKEWDDDDSGKKKVKTFMICDGKMLNEDGMIFITKKTTTTQA